MTAPDRLLLDVMCGKLATYLRMCGHDAAYALDRDVEADDALLAIAGEEDRTLVTRDRGLAARTDDAVLLESPDVVDQLRELGDHGIECELTDPERCSRCNGRLDRVPEDGETSDYAPAPDERSVWRCRDCGQAFWRGSHWDRVRETLRSV